MQSPRVLNNRITEEEFGDLVNEIYDESEEEFPDELRIRKLRDIYYLSRKAEIDRIEKDDWEKRYIQSVLDYGFRLKRNWANDGKIAIRKFENVIQVAKNVPVANYRLGHIYFKQKDYHKALINFEMALINNQSCNTHVYQLETIQENVAKKFSTYCSLKLFEEYRESSLENEKYSELNEQIEKYLYLEKDLENLDLLVFRKFNGGSLEEVKLIKEKEYLDLKDDIDSDKNSMHLDGYLSQRYIGYSGKGRDFPLSFTVLKNLLTGKVIEANDGEFHKGNTFNQQIKRLRSDLKSQGITKNLLRIENKSGALPTIHTNLNIYLFTSIGE